MKKRKKRKKVKILLEHRQILKNIVEDIGKGKKATITDAAQRAGFSESYATNGTLTQTDSWKALLEEALSDEKLIDIHKQLLSSMHLDHMTFPIYTPDKEDDGTQLSDEDIKELLESTGCTVRRIVHGDSARHVYFWSPDNLARDRALDKAYKLKKRYEQDLHVKHSFQRPLNEIEEEIAGALSEIGEIIQGKG